MTQLEFDWLEIPESSPVQLCIWRASAQAEQLMQAFFALQRTPERYPPTLRLLGLSAPFEQQQAYSHALADEVVHHLYQGDRRTLPEISSWLPCRQAGDIMALLEHIARQQPPPLRQIVAMLAPAAVSDAAELLGWLRAALVHATPAVRLILVDTSQQPVWQPLLTEYPQQVRLLDCPIS